MKPVTYHVGEWVLIKFPADESGKMRKLARPWHGLYCITEVNGPNVSANKVYLPQKDVIKVHQSRVKHCPVEFPAGFYWYGGRSKGPGRPPKWVEQLLAGKNTNKEVVNTAEENESSDKQAETDVAQMNIKRGDPPMIHENVDTRSGENLTTVREECTQVPVANSDPQPRGRNTHYGLRQCPQCSKKGWSNA